MVKRKRRPKVVESVRKKLTGHIILAIDPASMLGWATSNGHYGTWDLRTRKDESIGMKLLRLEAKLEEMHALIGCTVVAYERAAGMHKASIMHQSKLIAIIEQWCERKGVQYRAFSATEIKKFATGKGNAGKPAMVKAAQENLGYTGADDNIADALWILQLAKFELGLGTNEKQNLGKGSIERV